MTDNTCIGSRPTDQALSAAPTEPLRVSSLPGNDPSRAAAAALAALRTRFGPNPTSGVHSILAHQELPEVFGKDEWAEWFFKPADAAFTLAFDMGFIAPWKLSQRWTMTPLGKELAAIVQQDLRDRNGSPEGRDAQRLDGEATTVRAEGIAHTQPESH